MPTEQTALCGRRLPLDLETATTARCRERCKPGLLSFRGWGLERRLGADRRALIEALRKDIEAMQKALPPKYTYVHGVRDVEKPVDLQVAMRGNPMRLGDEVPRAFLTVLSPASRRHSRRAAAGWSWRTTSSKQPLAARVIVNRIWKGHFGTGIVNTPSNFGMNGERPTHPELLDYLAQTFIDNGLSIKELHREIMLSAVYQLSADDDAANFAKDAGNRLYWRAEPPAAERRTDPRLGALRLRRARH